MIAQSVYFVPGLARRDVELVDMDVLRFHGQFDRPLRTSHGTLTQRETVIVRLRAEIGGFTVTGYGEAAPLDGWSSERLSHVRLELGRARDMVFGGAATDAGALLESLVTATARHAFSTAMLDAIAHARRRPLRRLFDPGAANAISLNATVGLEAPAQAVATAVSAWEQGFRTIKLKAGDDDDIARVQAVRKALPDAILRLDANAAWDVETATERLAALAPCGIDYVEQPVADVDELARVAANSPIPIAADESCLPLAVAHDLVKRRGVQVLVLKPALLGAWGEILQLVRDAETAGIRVIFTSALESAVGRAATAQMAAALLGGDEACGLATNWFIQDLRMGEDQVHQGRLYLGSGNGLGLKFRDDDLGN